MIERTDEDSFENCGDHKDAQKSRPSAKIKMQSPKVKTMATINGILALIFF